MIEDLQVLNGNLELKFDKYTYEYTVTCDENIDKLDFSYVLNDGVSIEIKNNDLKDYENTVYLNVYTIDEEVTYTFYVYKGESTSVVGIDNYFKSLEIEKNEEIPFKKVQLLCVGTFFIIIILFSLIFRKRKKAVK